MIALLITSMLLGQADGTIVRRRDVSGTGSTVVPTAIQTTNGNATYFVTTAGNDTTNTCISASAPCLTIQGALSKIPKNIYHQIDVSVGTGNFAGFAVEGFHIHGSNQAAQPYLRVSGTMSAFTPATGTSTGTLTAFSAGSGATFAVFTDGGQTWTINDLKGKILQITSGTGATATAFYVITSNTATAITALSGTAAAAAASSGYAILDWGTVINTSLAAQSTGPGLAGGGSIVNWTAAGIRMTADRSDGLVGNSIVLQKMALSFGVSTSRGISVGGALRPTFQWMKFGPNVSTAIGVDYTTWVGVYGSYFSAPSGAVSLGSNGPAGATVAQSFLENGAVGVSGGLQGLVITGSLFKGQSNAAITGYFVTTIINTSRIDGAAWGIKGVPVGVNGGSGPGSFGVDTTDISNCTVAGVSLTAPGTNGVFGTISGTGNLIGWEISLGARAQIQTPATMTGTTEISLDGVGTTLATMRAAGPPALLSNTYFSMVYGGPYQ